MIKISSLHFSYGKRSKLFADLNLLLNPGYIYGLLGKNGTGKSTLLNLISGLLFPKAGSITVMDQIPGRRQLDFLREIFLVSEEFYIPDVSPKGYAGLFAFFYPRFNETQYKEFLNELEVDPDQKMTKMSMGQRKKAFIAFALACNTRLLIMDEPTNGLDIPSKAQFRRLIASVTAEERCIIISTHQVRDLENLIDTVLVLEDHHIIFNQKVDDISGKLAFVSYNDSEKPVGSLYEEPGVLGGKAVIANHSGKPSRVDMELLFNAVVAKQSNVMEIFNDNGRK